MRRADEIIRAFRHLRMRRGQIHRARPEMVRAFFGGGPRGGRMQIRIADDGEVVAEWLQRLQRLAQFEIARLPFPATSNACSSPRRCCPPTPCTISMQARRVLGDRRGLAQRRLRRHHRIEQRQRQRYAHAAQNGAPGKMFFRDEHAGLLTIHHSDVAAARDVRSAPAQLSSALLIWNGALFTIPRTNDEKRLSFLRRFPLDRRDHRHVAIIDHAAQPVSQQVLA